MIQANELRIGNFIYKFGIDYIGDNPIVDRDNFEIIKVDIDVLKNIEDFNGTTDFYYTEPIPLTEEILLKYETRFNGIRHRAEIWIQGECFEFIVDKDKFHLEFTGGEGVSYSKPIYFLHQLQNLYFALTNEELTFNNL